MEPVDGSDIEALLKVSALGARALIAAATDLVASRLGERGSCVLVGDTTRVVLSSELPALVDLPLDIARYPEIALAVSTQDLVLIEDVKTAAVLAPVAALLPRHLGAIAVVPVVAGERCLAVITVRSSAPRTFSPAEARAAQLDGHLVGTLLDLRFGDDLLHQLGCATAPGGAKGTTTGCQVVRGRWTGSSPTAPCAVSAALAAPPTASLARAGEHAAASPTGRRLLLADDDTEDAAWLAELLGDEGFDVACAVNGADAIAQAQQNPPDLLLLDVHMPVMDGFSAAAELAEDVRTVSIPILFLSGSEDLMSRVRNFDRDGVDFLRKPFTFLELVARIEKSLKQADSKKHLRLDANLDELTGLGNLRCLREHVEKEQSRMGRTGSPLATVMIDVDKLKRINDEHGHVVGSKVLRAIGDTLKSEVRPTDLAVRYGGDEFVVLLPHTREDEGVAFAERLLAHINALCPEGITVTLSMGVAAVDRLAGLSVEGVLARADAAAYRAKHLGGNRVCKHGDDSPMVQPPSPDLSPDLHRFGV